ncbi:DUF1435 family protein [Pantoea sp. 1.19]|uniref:DUF1435 family protein n=1 Tax=Pantoea sp. 1.19 TaxID=1925589 RepID=UPI0009FB0239|nr:DUF1435 family protein [Pantoea sp. 1.19]
MQSRVGHWALSLPCAAVPVMMLLDLTLMQWRSVVLLALLTTVSMLYHPRLRSFMLLPSSVAVTGAMVAILLACRHG